MIKKTGSGYTVFTKDGKKKLSGPYKTEKEAKKRIQQIEFFKRQGK